LYFCSSVESRRRWSVQHADSASDEGNRAERSWEARSDNREGLVCRSALAREAVRSIEGAAHPEGAAVEDVGVDHGGSHAVVAEEFLDGADIVAGLEEVRRKAVTQGVVTRARREVLAALLASPQRVEWRRAAPT
jgi:hypothetical protein